ncbi:hypothetical protein OSB04_014946 [Centaurea solstitialis]|uniref:Tf2-1-like SH3-like domain-containing protein n=1 Tax=Centaurea solstitialis TaxID=347529 RepID=A0AA38T992_9ASTR|nr:hypothetical protein OSB04_014946 [Centaurea solstitialis]
MQVLCCNMPKGVGLCSLSFQAYPVGILCFSVAESTAKYKSQVDKKHREVDFCVGDYVWAVLTKDRFPAHEYNKLAAKKIGPVEIVENVIQKAYRLHLPSHIRTSDVFNVKHLLPYTGDNSSEDDTPPDSRTNLSAPGRMMQLNKKFYSWHVWSIPKV